MADVKARGKTFDMEVKQTFGGGNVDLLTYLKQFDAKLQRTAIRKMVAAAGTQLAREIRVQIKRRDMPYSRARNAAERRKARERTAKPLLRTIRSRAWSRAAKGLFGAVVGPAYDGGRHGHLVEFGHEIRGHFKRKIRQQSVKQLERGEFQGRLVGKGRRRIARSGTRTIAHGFQQEAMREARSQIYNGMFNAMRKAIDKAGVARTRA